MISKESHIEQQPEVNKLTDSEREIDLIKNFQMIISIRKILYKAVGIGGCIGIIIALSIPKQYTVKMTLSPEIGNVKGGNGLAGIAATFLGSDGINGDNSDALNVSLAADIVASTPFLLELISMNVTTSQKQDMSLSDYLDNISAPWWSYLFGAPGMLIDGVKSLFITEEQDGVDGKMNNGIIELTKDDLKKINILKRNVSASIDKKTIVTTITTSMQDPRVAAIVADSVVQKLQEYIINYRTSKAKEDCAYLEELFKERQHEYYLAQKQYANYIDTHDNLVLQIVRAEQERLQNDMNLAYQVYSQVANQLQVARAKVQEEKPVFAVVEPAVVPIISSSIGIKVYVVVFMFLSLILTLGWSLFGAQKWRAFKKEIKIK